MVDPSTSRSEQVVFVVAIKKKITDKTAREVMRDKYKRPIPVKGFKGQEEPLKALTKFMIR